MTGMRRWAPPVVLVLSLLAMIEGVYAHGSSPLRTLLRSCPMSSLCPPCSLPVIGLCPLLLFAGRSLIEASLIVVQV